jgi:hypothetical protein
MEMYSVSEKCLTAAFHNFGRTSTIDRSHKREALGDKTLRFAPHEESHVPEGFG